MPPYDPKAKRPKLVPVDDTAEAPVDALLGPTETPAPHLSVVRDEPTSSAPASRPAPVSTAPAAPAAASGPDRRILLAAVAVAVVAVVVFVARRR